MIRVTRRYRFPAAHVLASAALDDAENRRIFGKCANPEGHGHDYGVEVTLRGPVQPESGSIIEPALLDALFDEVVRERYSHRMLNELPRFTDAVPTAENIARAIYEDLEPAVAARSTARVASVRVVETPKNYFDYGERR